MTPRHTAVDAKDQGSILLSQPTHLLNSILPTMSANSPNLYKSANSHQSLCSRLTLRFVQALRPLFAKSLLTAPLLLAPALLLSPLANASIFTSSNAIILSSNGSSNGSSSGSYAAPAAAFPQWANTPGFMQSYDNLKPEHASVVLASEAMATPAAQQVLRQVRVMALDQRAILPGGCWDYLNAAFKRAGISRDTVFEGTYRAGPYADSESLRSGDWLYYINHGYNDIEHSGLFIGWVDKPSRQALILSYAGESRHEPARYKVYDLSHVYQIMRPIA